MLLFDSESHPPWSRHDDHTFWKHLTLGAMFTILAIMLLSVLFANSQRSRLSLRGLHSQAKVFTLLTFCLPFAEAIDWALSDASTVIPDVYTSPLESPDPQIVT